MILILKNKVNKNIKVELKKMSNVISFTQLVFRKLIWKKT